MIRTYILFYYISTEHIFEEGDFLNRFILHSDLNNFYASVECLYQPSIRNKPVAVSGNAEKRCGIVLAKNDLAKRFGVKTGDTIWQAREKCPNILFVPPSYDKYLHYSQMAKEIYSSYTNQVESFGLDECWLDVSGSTKLFGEAKTIADTIRKRIFYELGVTASVGVSFNKIFAKLGSDMKKPNATTVISPDNYKQTAWPLPVEELLYVGKSSAKKLKQYGIYTIGDLAKADCKLLKQELGKNGVSLWIFANGQDQSPVRLLGTSPPIHSIGNSTTLPYDITSTEEIKITLYALCESIGERLQEQNLYCSTIQVGIRDNHLSFTEHQSKLPFPTYCADSIFKKAFSLCLTNMSTFPIRSLHVRASQLDHAHIQQLSYLQDFQLLKKKEQAESTIHSLRQRFGHFSIQRAVMLTNPNLSQINPKEDHIIHPIGFLT